MRGRTTRIVGALAGAAVLAAACERESAPAPETAVVEEPVGAAECPPPIDPTRTRLPEQAAAMPGDPEIDVVAANLRWIGEDALLAASIEVHGGEVRFVAEPGRVRVEAAPDGTVARLLGLRTGDVIVGVDGVAPDAAMLGTLQDRVRAGGRISLDVEHDGARMRLHYHVRPGLHSPPPAFERLLSLMELGVALGEGTTPTKIDRAVLTTVRTLALAGTLGLSRSRTVWATFGVPVNARVIAIDGVAVADDGVEAALATLADKPSFTLGLDADGSAGSSRTLQYEAVEGLVLEADLAAAATKLATAEPTIPSGPPVGVSAAAAEFAASVVAESETRYVIDRAKLDALLADPASMLKMARIVPAVEDGTPRGFKVFGIRRDTPFQALGFKNGDTVRSIDGEELGGLEDAMAAFTKLRKSTAKKVTVGVARKGKELTFEYRFR